ncbi:MAG: hypothetical protein MAG431_00786 [Chloroflexi bacterium]|nr:hypothetical protein [Chloroflexota bacterium]
MVFLVGLKRKVSFVRHESDEGNSFLSLDDVENYPSVVRLFLGETTDMNNVYAEGYGSTRPEMFIG